MAEESIWRTWKPYVVIGGLAIAGIWWWNTQSPAAGLKDGVYDCVAVFVNESNDYQVYADNTGAYYDGYARVEGGDVTSYSAPNVLNWQNGAPITVRKAGTSNFDATQDPAMHSYDALACEWSGS